MAEEQQHSLVIPEKYQFADVEKLENAIGSNPVNSFDDLVNILCQNRKFRARYEGLRQAIDLLERYMHNTRNVTDFSFYNHVLPMIIQFALDKSLNRELTLLEIGNVEEKFTAQEALHFLSHAFFLNITLIPNAKIKYGELDFYLLYNTATKESIQRLVCQLSYFTQMAFLLRDDSSAAFKTPSGDPVIINFQRSQMQPDQDPNWDDNQEIIHRSAIKITKKRMEDPNIPVFVDFANCQLHIGQIIPSLTQEEVLFSCCPEAFLGLMICSRIRDDEIIVIKGCRRFSDYQGYLSTFVFTKFYEPALACQDILVIDAVMHDQFKKFQLDRDLNKAYLGFLRCDRQAISTGHWGKSFKLENFKLGIFKLKSS
eukprot:TRINITY_DN6680_c0_g1_i3.p1 TRINITY_DN6680_c0_g1~~TRINITY_DN6680_c0_g1_i3.p1  ORF type:complete len:397 (-),score=119.00 TRINITY_DN6680_c0_g1_i3:299-1408(-)